MRSEFEKVVTLLNDSELDYWVDAGSLLGIIRDGHLLDSDPDIDFATWFEEKDNILRFLEVLKDSGFETSKKLYDGQLYGCTAKPLHTKKYERKIDIHVLQRNSEYAWSPSKHLLKNNFNSPDPRYFLLGFPRYLFDKASSEFDEIDFSNIPWRYIHEFRTFIVPIDLVENSIIHSQFGVPIPHKAQEYLEYRYGNWQTPVSDWDWWEDDNAIVNTNPRAFQRQRLDQ